MESNKDIYDPEKEEPEFCLDCAEKHQGQAMLKIGEALDRLRNIERLDEQSSVDNLVEFVLLHVNQAQAQLSEVEHHTTGVTKSTPKERKILDDIAHEARTIRDKLRNFNKSFPQEPQLNYILEAENLAKKLNSKILFSKKEIGCGQCLAQTEELEKIRQQLLAQNVPQTIIHQIPRNEEPVIIEKVAVVSQQILPNKTTIEQQLNEQIPNFEKDIKKAVSRVETEVFSLPKMLLQDISKVFLGDLIK